MTRKEMSPALKRAAIVAVVVLAFAAGIVTQLYVETPPSSGEGPQELKELATATQGIVREMGNAAIRLPIAALLGTVLALRPRPRGATRSPVVVQTQIVLSVVGALIMLVVGASLARAFGIVGVASLVRYRSKVDDPKDAVVMLSALAVGLACGVGLLFLAVFGTLFLVATLWVIESFQPQARVFELSVKLGDATDTLRPRIEAALRRLDVELELRTSSAEEASYRIRAPRDFSTERATAALVALVPDGKGSVEWSEKNKPQ